MTQSNDWRDQYTHWLGERVQEKADELRPKIGSGADELLMVDVHSQDVMRAFEAGWGRAMTEYRKATGRG